MLMGCLVVEFGDLSAKLRNRSKCRDEAVVGQRGGRLSSSWVPRSRGGPVEEVEQ